MESDEVRTTDPADAAETVPDDELEPGTDQAAPSLGRVLPAVVLAWALPGVGHVVLRRVRRGVLFGCVILCLFVGGIALHGKVYRPEPDRPLSYLAALGAAGVGIPYAAAHLTGYGTGNVESAYHDYGNTFTLVAGLLNLLVLLDAYDIAVGRR